MGRLTIWLRQGGALLGALVLVMAAAGPSLDALICSHDTDEAVAAQQVAPVSADAPDTSPGHSGQDSDICPHGHCHHAVPYMATAFAVLRGVHQPPPRFALVSTPIRIDGAVFELNRPPRA